MAREHAGTPSSRQSSAASGDGVWSALGAGLITGASDDDPSGIATYSQAGASFGYQLAWTLLFTYPLMVVIQEVSARIGRVTGKGVAGNLQQHYPRWLLHLIVLLLLCANTLNLGADLGAMAEAARLLVPPVPQPLWIVLFGVVCAAVQIWLSHERYVAVLKWLTLVLLSYFGVLAVIHLPWAQVLRGILMPSLSLNGQFWLMVIAILGTTISPYLFFWQAGQEAEDTKAHPYRVPLLTNPAQGPSALARIRLDTLVGMGASNLVGLAILITAATTLHQSGTHEIQTAAQAAQTLRPIAGEFAFLLFALGIVGTGLLSIPVLAGSAAYALGEARRWPVGLAREPLQAKAFYATILAAIVIGAIANVLSVSPMQALVWAAVINGIVAVPLMTLLMRMAVNTRVMGRFTVSGPVLWLGWLATGVMAAAAVGWVVSWFTAAAN
jgi:NRAMP (natural resistance-associated macrophage protein)-like metal ion transporter